jgi:hypothetical protein
MVNHFQEAKDDSMQDKTKRCTQKELQKKITTTNFILGLRLTCHALQELSDFSLDMQEHEMALYKPLIFL